MRHPASARLLVLLAAALLIGHGAALHHDHRSIARCPTGTCIEHGGHADVPPTVAGDEACPLCELGGQGRATSPAVADAHAPAPLEVASAPPGESSLHRAPVLAGLHARAPPRLA